SVYADGHVQGARSFPVWELDIGDRVKAFFEEGLIRMCRLLSIVVGETVKIFICWLRSFILLALMFFLLIRMGFLVGRSKTFPSRKKPNRKPHSLKLANTPLANNTRADR